MNRLWRMVLAVIAFLSVSLAVIGQSAAPHADSNAAAEGEVKAEVAKLIEMIVKGDWNTYAQHLAPDYFRTTYDARVENKVETLASLRDPQRKIIVMEMEPDQRVRIYGDTAISNAEFTVSVRESGHLKTRRLRITDILVKHEGQWYVVAEQSTSIGK